MMPGQKKHRISAVARPDAAQPAAVHPRFRGHIVDRAQVIAYILPAVIARNLIQPLLSERRHAAPVRCDDHVSLRRHQLQIPTVTPELAYDALRSSLTVQQRRIAFGRIEIRRQHDPRQHLPAVGSPYPTFAHLPHPDMIVDFRIGIRDPGHRSVRRIDPEKFGRSGQRSHFADQFAPVQRNRIDIVRPCGQHAHRIVRQADPAHLIGSPHRRNEIQRPVPVPTHVSRIVIEVPGQVAFFAGSQRFDEQSALVRLVPGPLHTGERQHRIVRRENRIFVVPGHPFGQVARLPGRKVVKVHVRIGAERIRFPGQLLTGIGQLGSGAVPRDFRNIEIGRRRGIPRLARHNIRPSGHFRAARQRSDENMTVAPVVPIIPVALHQVVVNLRLRTVQIGINFRRTALFDRHPGDVHQPVLRRSDRKALDAAGDVGHLTTVVPVRSRTPNLVAASVVGNKIDRTSVCAPLRRRLVAAGIGDPDPFAPGYRRRTDVGHSLVLFHVVGRNRIKHGTAVGRKGGAADPLYFPHYLGRQYPRRSFGVGQYMVSTHLIIVFSERTAVRQNHPYAAYGFQYKEQTSFHRSNV